MIKSILHTYEVASGQQVTYNKSNVMFSKNIPLNRKDEVLTTLDIKEVLSHDKYLNLNFQVIFPTIFSPLLANIDGDLW